MCSFYMVRYIITTLGEKYAIAQHRRTSKIGHDTKGLQQLQLQKKYCSRNHGSIKERKKTLQIKAYLGKGYASKYSRDPSSLAFPELENNLKASRPRPIPILSTSIEDCHPFIMLSNRAMLRIRASASQRVIAARAVPASQFRSYATPAADSKPPIALYGLDGTYATALVRLYPHSPWKYMEDSIDPSWRLGRVEGLANT